MSRTYKDRHWKLRFPESDWRFGTERIPYEAQGRVYDFDTNKYLEEYTTVIRYTYVSLPGIKTKKKRRDNTEYGWLGSTPSWWTRIMMNRPQRRKGRVWERKVLFEDFEESDPPGVGRKPHQYYW